MTRLDVALVRRGLVKSRARAKDRILGGQVSVNGVVCRKPAYSVDDSQSISLSGADIPFVGRGGLKLEYVLDRSGLDLKGKICMDIGASTGGFTDCMRKHGVKEIYAVDVGHGQLAQSLRRDSRVHNLEGTDIRALNPDDLPKMDFIAIDVSFISLSLVLPAAKRFLRRGGDMAVLIKPQFEAGRENIGKNGLVLRREVHVRVLNEKLRLFQEQGLSLRLLCPSPIRGRAGNIEYLALLKSGGEDGVLPDLQAIVENVLKKREKP